MRIMKYKDLELEIPSGPMWKAKGEAKVVVMDANGRVVHETDWIPNMILNNAFPLITGTNWRSCYWNLGDGGAAAVETQTGLQGTRISEASNGGEQPQIIVSSGAPDYIGSYTHNRRFDSLTTGTIRELVLTNGSQLTDAQNNAHIRVVITPEVPVTAGQVVDVYYKYNFWPDQTASYTGQITLDGELYDWTSRMSNVAISPGNITTYNPMGYIGAIPNFSYARGYDGPIGTLTQFPSGNTGFSGNCATIGVTSTTTSGTRSWYTFFNLNDCNFASGLRSINCQCNPFGGMQVQFDKVSDGTAIPKDADKTLRIDMSMTWGRYTP